MQLSIQDTYYVNVVLEFWHYSLISMQYRGPGELGVNLVPEADIYSYISRISLQPEGFRYRAISFNILNLKGAIVQYTHKSTEDDG